MSRPRGVAGGDDRQHRYQFDGMATRPGMVADLVAQYWNDVLTVASFLVAVVTGVYQIQHYRAQQATISVVEVKDASYNPRKEIRLDSGSSGAPNFDDTTRPRAFLDEESEFVDSYYSVTPLLENNGREPATISKVSLILPDEEIELVNDHDEIQRLGAHLELDSNERRIANFDGIGAVREDYTEPISATLQLDTTAGTENHPVTLTSPEE